MSAQSLPASEPLTLIVFAFNESSNVDTVLPPIRDWLAARSPKGQLLFVDDGSTDDTAARARAVLAGTPGGAVLSHPKNRGIGAALKTGVRAATGTWVTFLPCDGQIAPEELDTLLTRAAHTQASLVFSVYLDRNDGLRRTLLSAGIRGLIRAAFGVRLDSDGPYLFQRALFDPDALPPDSFFLNFEFPIRALRRRQPFEVVSIHCRPRHAGVSKSTGWRRILGVARDLVDLRVRMLRE